MTAGLPGPGASRLETLVATGVRPIVTGELPVVDGGGLAAVRRALAPLLGWVDAVNATDNAAAHAHASSLAVAAAIHELGAEPVLQVVGRDRNRLAIQADIVGASLFGIVNVCCLTGDDVSAGDEPEARRVFDLDGPEIVRVATLLGEGSYLSGRAIDPAPHLFVGAVENPGAPPLDYRVRRAEKKVAAGARFLQLQICFHPERLEKFCSQAQATGLAQRAALLPTVCLVRGGRALRFMDRHVPGISIPEDTIRRVHDSGDESEAAYQLALEQARHALAQPGVRGLHLSDFRRDQSVARLLTDLGLRPRDHADPTTHTPPGEEPHAHDPAL
ncbi:MAG: methylenetetrahydrofolate reductase, partial [Actinomycetes bacterium]